MHMRPFRSTVCLHINSSHFLPADRHGGCAASCARFSRSTAVRPPESALPGDTSLVFGEEGTLFVFLLAQLSFHLQIANQTVQVVGMDAQKLRCIGVAAASFGKRIADEAPLQVADGCMVLGAAGRFGGLLLG